MNNVEKRQNNLFTLMKLFLNIISGKIVKIRLYPVTHKPMIG